MLLDLGLPDMDGVEVIKAVRQWSMMFIIVVSARSEGDDKVAALDAGADDLSDQTVQCGRTAGQTAGPRCAACIMIGTEIHTMKIPLKTVSFFWTTPQVP